MCVSPVMIDGVGPVWCRKCWKCLEDRLDGYVGRAMAEMETARKTAFVTLTYGTSHKHSQFLVYSDVQNMMKRLNKAGHKARYIVAGEYGSLRGRAHWHAILYFNSDIELPELEEASKKEKELHRVKWRYWPHGHTTWQHAGKRGARYLLKYSMKQTGQDIAQSHFALSKKPIIGQSYLYQLAWEYGSSGWLPLKPQYEVKQRPYYLNKSSRDLFLKVANYASWSTRGKPILYLPDWADNIIQSKLKDWDGYYDEKEQASNYSFRAPFRPEVRAAIYERENIAANKRAAHLYDPQSACACTSCRQRSRRLGTAARRFQTPF